MPCSDNFSHLQENQTESLISFDVHQAENSTDQCSPFCQCHCCHVHVTEFNTLQFKSITQTEIIGHNFVYIPNDGLTPIKRLFEPPRV